MTRAAEGKRGSVGQHAGGLRHSDRFGCRAGPGAQAGAGRRGWAWDGASQNQRGSSAENIKKSSNAGDRSRGARKAEFRYNSLTGFLLIGPIDADTFLACTLLMSLAAQLLLLFPCVPGVVILVPHGYNRLAPVRC
jgi:hypothetical protein